MANTLNVGNGDWATKENSLLGYNSENGNYKPLPFDFTRASNGTFVNKSGLIETAANGVPRIDFSDSTKGALKLEPQRTNLIPYSSDYTDASWAKSELSVSNGFISPDGTLNAKKITESTSNSKHQTFTTISSYTELTISFFAKKAERSFISVEKSSWGTTVFNLNDGSVVSGTGSVVDFGNGWYRCSATYTASPAQSQFYILLMKDENTVAYQGDGTSGLYLWGCQAEVGSYATSLINTQGSAVTRVVDVCNNGGNDQVINSTEGVFYFEGSALANDGTFKRISIGTSDDLFANSIQLRYNTADNSITYQFRVGNVYQADLTITANTTNVNKIACVWKINRFEIWVNGVKQAEDTSGSVPSSNTFNSLFFGKTSTSLTEPFYGNCKDLKVYNTALTDAELIALTS